LSPSIATEASAFNVTEFSIWRPVALAEPLVAVDVPVP
jgi:hypothetical protein